MSSLPESYRPSLQTIMAAERVNKLAGGQSSGIKSNNLMAFLIEEAQHRLINEQRGKNAELALAAYSKSSGKIKSAKKDKSDKPKSDLECDNCKQKGHVTEDCFAKGGGKEGQALWQNKGKQKEAATIVEAKDDEEEMFAFTCTSDYTDIAAATPVLKSSFGTCIDSGASNNYSPDQTKFSNYQEIDKDISTADGHVVKAIGMGDLHLELPNGSKTMKVTFKDAIHSPSMAFTLLSIGKLDTSGHKVTLQKQMCTIQDSKGSTIVQIPHLQGLYKVIMDNKDKPTLQANAAAGKMTISEAHHKLGHISSVAIKHAVSKGFITGITLDNNSKPEFCDACAKAKSVHKPFPQESDTRAEKYGDRVHWDLWGPAAVKSINGNHYLAARIDDATHETKLYFQEKKSQTFESYKKDEAYIETQTGNQITVVRSDRGGEFQTKKFTDYQDMHGTV